MQSEVNAPTSRVRFANLNKDGGNARIGVRKLEENNYEINVGYISVYHKYKCAFKLPIDPNTNNYVLCDNKFQSKCTTNVTMKKLTPTSKKLNMTFELFAHKEKILREHLHLTNDEGVEIQLLTIARVIGPERGTPALREGVTSIAYEPGGSESSSSESSSDTEN